ncbi:GNAT family N-acetyltransferase [Actinoplanes sp. TRM 88003]|uniref:GNAT family N-acetyltransferase n=1 Tax=Paractinoplanes aksuensis TaxID=2939490 RepID=A0ABT1DPS8_9ACTN|nr:GNAT family N-acetyltransferase [Actinoplanes aksuensis]MCO8272847.1 GNAT family N-acetyltransferase [Actinoplanes aksuensis]
MAIEFVVDPPLTPQLRAEIITLWVEVTNAGGAVGFVAPVSRTQVTPVAEAAFAGVESGVDHLLTGYDDGELVALLFVVSNRFDLKDHWQVLKRVMVTPKRQGRGYGAALMREAEQVARGLGLEALQVTVRGGAGTEKFYERLGYTQVGRVPGALRVAPDDDRDEFLYWLPLGA